VPGSSRNRLRVVARSWARQARDALGEHAADVAEIELAVIVAGAMGWRTSSILVV
jgi:hypothetical protein